MKVIALTLAATTLAVAKDVDFSREVLPILSDACFKCHGPDDKARKAKLRLDTKEGLFRTDEGVTVVKPGDLKGSELVSRITTDDEDDVMPRVTQSATQAGGDRDAEELGGAGSKVGRTLGLRTDATGWTGRSRHRFIHQSSGAKTRTS
jgi:hypothetical protein